MPLFSTPQLDAICQTLRDCGSQAVAMAQQTFQVYEKGKRDYVTDVDRALDAQLTRAIAHLFPEDGIISEENPVSRDRFTASPTPDQRLWLIDPLDGTEDFIERKPYYAIMVGLLAAGRATAGWVYAPASEQLYWGGLGIGVFAATGTASPQLLPLPCYSSPTDHCTMLLGMQDQRRFAGAIAHQIPTVQFHTFGSFGLKVLEVVMGRADLYVYLNRKVKLWDTVGPLAIAQAAGLVCCDLQGNPIRFSADAIDPNTLAHTQPILLGYPDKMARWYPALQHTLLPLWNPEP